MDDLGIPTSRNGLGASALELTLQPLRAILDDPDVTELCINRPGEAFIERAPDAKGQCWTHATLPFADFPWCYRLAKLIANASHQHLGSQHPLLSATLPTGERAQIVLPPATTDGCVSITIRRPAKTAWTLADLARNAIREPAAAPLNAGSVPTTPTPNHSETLASLLAQNRQTDFLRAAVRARKNILVSGPTGSGKTTWTKALIAEIPPHERLITIEDARELDLTTHPNHVRLYYSKDGQGQAAVTPKQLLEATLRMRPDRILLAELRGEEAFTYLRNVNSGHPGSITSIHAGSPALAFEQLMLLVKESPAGRELARDDILELLHQSIDIVIQMGVENGRRQVRELYAPKLELRRG